MIGMRDEVTISCPNEDALFLLPLPLSRQSRQVSSQSVHARVSRSFKVDQLQRVRFFVQPPFHSSSVKKFFKGSVYKALFKHPFNIKGLDVLLHISTLKQIYYLENISLKMSSSWNGILLRGSQNLSQGVCCNLS